MGKRVRDRRPSNHRFFQQPLFFSRPTTASVSFGTPELTNTAVLSSRSDRASYTNRITNRITQNEFDLVVAKLESLLPLDVRLTALLGKGVENSAKLAEVEENIVQLTAKKG